MTWADECKALRAARNQIQKEFADSISPNLSVRTVEKWEAGVQTPPPWVRDLIRARLKLKK